MVAVTWPCSAPWRTRPESPRPRERQREGIEQDGFARAGLAGQHREATGEFDIESFDQDDVTDRQTRQHAK
jgi:hypothetical protein